MRIPPYDYLLTIDTWDVDEPPFYIELSSDDNVSEEFYNEGVDVDQ